MTASKQHNAHTFFCMRTSLSLSLFFHSSARALMYWVSFCFSCNGMMDMALEVIQYTVSWSGFLQIWTSHLPSGNVSASRVWFPLSLWIFFPGPVIPLPEKLVLQWLPCHVPGVRPPCWPSGKASTSRAEGPRIESRLRRDFFGVESYQWLQNWHSSGYPARRLAL